MGGPPTEFAARHRLDSGARRHRGVRRVSHQGDRLFLTSRARLTVTRRKRFWGHSRTLA
jgi:hypothetical protein